MGSVERVVRHRVDRVRCVSCISCVYALIRVLSERGEERGSAVVVGGSPVRAASWWLGGVGTS